MSFLGIAIGAAAVGGVVKYTGARKAEKRANKNFKKADLESKQASAALARAEQQSMVPGFGDSTNIPGYSTPSVSGITNTPSQGVFSALSPAQQRNLNNRDRSLGREIPQSTAGLGGVPGSRGRPSDRGYTGEVIFEPYGGDDVGDRASRTIIQPRGNPMDRGYQEAVRAGYDPMTGVTMRNNRGQNNRGQNLTSELLKRRFAEVTRALPKTPAGLPIFPDPDTKEGKDFYSTLPKSIADMATDPNMAQMYKGSNIVNPYANVRDISGIAEDVSDLIQDRSDLIQDRTDLIQDRTNLLSNRSDLFESAVDIGSDLSTGAQDLSIGREDLSGRVTDLRRGAQDFSGLASDTSVLASNAYANLQVATQAADLQAQQSDQALANTLSTIRATGAGAGGATAIAQAALQSKLNISATIEQQEARNVQSRADGQQQIEQIRMGESRRLQDIAFSERIRLEGLRQSEGLRIDDTRLDEGRALRDLSVSEGRRLQDLTVSEGRRMQELGISERLREQGLNLDESLRLQQADYDQARERDKIRFDETGRSQQVRFDEAGRLQEAQANEQIRIQNLRMSEQQRLQQADAMAREYQFGVAETREQNRLNRLQDMQTQKMQTSADLEASKVAAKANRQGAIVSGLTGIASAAISAS